MSNPINILIICDHYLPGYKAGGPVVSVAGVVQSLKGAVQILVVTKDRDYGDRQPYGNVSLNKINGRDGYSVLYLTFFGRLLEIWRLPKPEVIYFNSFFSPFSLLALLVSLRWKEKVLRVLAPRGELGAGALAIKPARKRIFIALFRLLGFSKRVKFHATSQNEAEDILRVLGASSVVLPNIPSPPPSSCHYASKSHGEARFIYLSRITRKKNLHLALSALREVSSGKVEYDLVGPIEDSAYWNECQRLIATLPPNVTVRYLGPVAYSEIPKVFPAYHALLLPTANENYGHAIVEAMQSGVLPVISDQTPWQDLSAAGVGWDISLNNSGELVSAIKEIVSMGQKEFSIMSDQARRYVALATNSNDLAPAYRALFGI